MMKERKEWESKEKGDERLNQAKKELKIGDEEEK